MKKIALYMVLAGSLGLAACSGAEEATETQDVDSTAMETTPADAATDAVEGAEADADAMGETMQNGVDADASITADADKGVDADASLKADAETN